MATGWHDDPCLSLSSWRSRWLALVLVAVAGCGKTTSDHFQGGALVDAPDDVLSPDVPGTPDGPATPYVLCNGTEGIRLGFQVYGFPGQPEPGVPLLAQNGFYYLFVDGSCTFWVFGPGPDDGHWQATHTGVLSGQQAAQLATDLQLDHWTDGTEWQGCDAAPAWFWREDATLHWTGCNPPPGQPWEPPVGQSVADLQKTARTWISQLWTAGAPVQTPIRLLAFPMSVGSGEPTATLGFDLAPMAVSYAEGQKFSFDDPAFLVTSPAALTELRVERMKVLAGDYTKIDGWPKFLPVLQGGIFYSVYYRDTVPYEDPNGLIKPSSP